MVDDSWLEFFVNHDALSPFPKSLNQFIESPTACYSLSLWSNWDAIPRFGTNVPYHVRAGNRIFGRLAITKERGFEIWSTKWKLVSVSNNLNWGDFDLRAVILGMQS
jgi:hypothetical protein